MSISTETVQKVAKLARLHLSEDPALLKKLEGELSAILDWVHELAQVDVSGVESLINPSQDFYAQAPMRKDQVTDGDKVEAVLSNAPEKAHDMFVVPKVVE